MTNELPDDSEIFVGPVGTSAAEPPAPEAPEEGEETTVVASSDKPAAHDPIAAVLNAASPDIDLDVYVPKKRKTTKPTGERLAQLQANAAKARAGAASTRTANHALIASRLGDEWMYRCTYSDALKFVRGETDDLPARKSKYRPPKAKAPEPAEPKSSSALAPPQVPQQQAAPQAPPKKAAPPREPELASSQPPEPKKKAATPKKKAAPVRATEQAAVEAVLLPTVRRAPVRRQKSRMW